MNREVTQVRRKRKGVEVWSRSTQGTNNAQEVVDAGEEEMEVFDELILCCDADTALQILGDDASWLERRILGNVKVRFQGDYSCTSLQLLCSTYGMSQ
jgi:predicted NAD/FAD-binding protein